MIVSDSVTSPCDHPRIAEGGASCSFTRLMSSPEITYSPRTLEGLTQWDDQHTDHSMVESPAFGIPPNHVSALRSISFRLTRRRFASSASLDLLLAVLRWLENYGLLASIVRRVVATSFVDHANPREKAPGPETPAARAYTPILDPGRVTMQNAELVSTIPAFITMKRHRAPLFPYSGSPWISL